jgi:hypothetical protein
MTAAADRIAGAHPMPTAAIATPIAGGMIPPPTIVAGNIQEVDRESPGLSFASQTIAVGKIGAIASPVTMYANGAKWPLSATRSATAATAEPEMMTVAGGTRSGMSAASNLPIAIASQKPEVSEAASTDPNPADSRCEVIQPPTPVSVPT